MAKTKGPGLSLAASGTIGDTLTFSNWRGRSYSKKMTRPTNPRSGPQVGGRAMMKFLSKQWSALAPGSKATYADLAAAAQISPYHAYLKENQKRWQTGLYPAQPYPAAVASNAATIAFTSASAFGFRMELSVFKIATNFNWGLIIYDNPSQPYDADLQHAIHIEPWSATADIVVTLGPFTAGQHYIMVRTFSTDGKFDASYPGALSVVITG